MFGIRTDYHGVGMAPEEGERIVDLVVRAQRGERLAMEELAVEATHRASRLVGAFSGRIEDEGDIVQAVVTDVFLGLKRLKDATCFGAWLGQIARRRTLDFLRRRYREAALGMFEAGLDLDCLPDSNSRASFLEPLWTEQVKEIEKEILALPVNYRRVLLPVLREGLALKEIAERTSLPPATVRTQYYRGLKLLRQRFGGAS